MSTTHEESILVVGGELDANIDALARTLSAKGVRGRVVRVGPGEHPRVVWDLEADRLTVDDLEVRPTGVFLRHDVFAHHRDGRAETAYRASAWTATLEGWLRAHPEVRRANGRCLATPSKPHVLLLARRAGLEIPATLVTNDMRLVQARAAGRELVYKPVSGGDYCREIGVMLEAGWKSWPATAPETVQHRLVQPEVRVYAVAGRYWAFTMDSPDLDYREKQTARPAPFPLEELPAGLLEGMARVMEELGLDWGAADFKTDPETGRLLFLEINSQPMFSLFDRITGGELAGAIVDFLAAPPAEAGRGAAEQGALAW
jgi:hypothetical protein